MGNDKIQELKAECEELTTGYVSKFCPEAEVKIVKCEPRGETQCLMNIEIKVGEITFTDKICAKDKADYICVLPGLILQAFRSHYFAYKSWYERFGCTNSTICKYRGDVNNAKKDV